MSVHYIIMHKGKDMQITETIYNEIKQRLVHYNEELNKIATYDYELANCAFWKEETAYLEGRIVETTYILELLDSLREKENKYDEDIPALI